MKTRLLLLVLAVLWLAAGVCTAQEKKRESKWHTVKGTVLDKSGRPAMWATVVLRDVGKKTVHMMQTDRNGRFTFQWVDLSVDHEIYAQRGKSASKRVPIPGAGARREVVIRIRLEDREAK